MAPRIPNGEWDLAAEPSLRDGRRQPLAKVDGEWNLSTKALAKVDEEWRRGHPSDATAAKRNPLTPFDCYNSSLHFPMSMKSGKAAVLHLRVMKSAFKSATPSALPSVGKLCHPWGKFVLIRGTPMVFRIGFTVRICLQHGPTNSY